MLKNDFQKAIRLKHYSPKTERAYWGWIVRFIKFNHMKHPSELRELEIENYLSSLAKYCSYSTQNQALQGILFLYKQVLYIKINRLHFKTPKRSKHIREVFTYNEATKIIGQLSGDYNIIALLMFGSGLRIGEAISLRIKDVDFENNYIWV